MSFIEKLFRVEERAIAKLRKQAMNVIAFEQEMKKLTDEQLKQKTVAFKKEFIYNGRRKQRIMPAR